MKIEGIEARLQKRAEESFNRELKELLNPVRLFASRTLDETQRRSADPNRIPNHPNILHIIRRQDDGKLASTPQGMIIHDLLGEIKKGMLREYLPMYTEIYIAEWLESVATWQQAGEALFDADEDPEPLG